MIYWNIKNAIESNRKNNMSQRIHFAIQYKKMFHFKTTNVRTLDMIKKTRDKHINTVSCTACSSIWESTIDAI